MQKTRVIILSVVLFTVGLCPFVCNHPGSKTPKPYNILWLTGESVRPDHLHVYGYPRETSPHIDDFARTGVLFKNAFNPSGWTSENMVSNLVGVNSLVHGVDVRNKSVPSRWHTPPEQLKDAGFVTARIQTFQNIPNYDYLGLDLDGSPDDLATWLNEHKDQRFFIWYHLLQAHLPYTPPDEHKKLFFNDTMITDASMRKRVAQIQQSSLVIRGEATFKEADHEAISALYDGAVHNMDAEFGKIIRTLEALGLRQNTLVIYSADHGDELLDHGFVGHASTAKGGHLHDEVSGPREPPPRALSEPDLNLSAHPAPIIQSTA
ncbi:MAG: sulfatase-like hydrolase/transferase [Deltaproteobacteria bacterium]|nr:sulfatase-like hydrolase/transferase [Deltaproteobacteria bacterium]